MTAPDWLPESGITMFKRLFGLLLLSVTAAAAIYAALLFAPKTNGTDYKLNINKGQGMSAVARKLEADGRIYSRHILLSAAYAAGMHETLKSGSYKLPDNLSAWQILTLLHEHTPDKIRIQIPEGVRFAQMRRIINDTDNISHDTARLSDAELMAKISPDAAPLAAEGMFFPDTYEIDAESSDIQIFQAAYRLMQRELEQAWATRQPGLPYQTPYELLIMASIIEKETGHAADRADISAVFRNRLAINMRLQTDPTVIYGMGDAYQGNIRRSDLERDTPYNTYTRHGLTPTPIALPGRAALQAAAHPSDAQYLYFVSRQDGTGKSQFSHNLQEHNAAVRRYILKK